MTVEEPRQYTKNEVQDMFIAHIHRLIDFWISAGGDQCTPEEKLVGLARGILATIDGCSPDMPGFVLAPLPHPSDEEFDRNNGDNWYPLAPDTDHNISGALHELLTGNAPT